LKHLVGPEFDFVGDFYDVSTNLLHYGACGEGTGQMLARMGPEDLEWLLPSQNTSPAIVLFLGGTNDVSAGVPREKSMENVGGIITNIDEHGRKHGLAITVLIGSLLPRLDDPLQETKKYNANLARLVEAWRPDVEVKLAFVDLYGAMVAEDGWAERLMVGGSDRWHPNPEGYAKVAEAWFQSIRAA
jgi:lysophospholipase L1-like esterase